MQINTTFWLASGDSAYIQSYMSACTHAMHAFIDVYVCHLRIFATVFCVWQVR